MLEAEAEIYENLKHTINSSVVQETKERLMTEFTQKEELLVKGFEGERNILVAKISEAEMLIAEEIKQVCKLNFQQEKACEKAARCSKEVCVRCACTPYVKSQSNISSKMILSV